MSKKQLFYRNQISVNHLNKKYLSILSKKFNNIFLNIVNEINNPEKTLNILNKNFKFNFSFKDLNKFKKFKDIAIIGMGGSILGAEAIYKFLKPKIKKQIHFFDDINENTLNKFKRKNLNNILFLVISKSGNTTETISNFFTLKIIKKNAKNIIFISENSNNLLNTLSKKLNLSCIHHKKFVGGRYSVLSEVGVIPLYFMDLNFKS